MGLPPTRSDPLLYPATLQDTRPSITFDGPCDSVYLNAPSQLQLEVGTGAAIAIDSSAWSDVVVWNPWTAMKDSYEHFVCVENVQFGQPVALAPGASWTAATTMTVVG